MRLLVMAIFDKNYKYRQKIAFKIYLAIIMNFNKIYKLEERIVDNSLINYTINENDLEDLFARNYVQFSDNNNREIHHVFIFNYKLLIDLCMYIYLNIQSNG